MPSSSIDFLGDAPKNPRLISAAEWLAANDTEGPLERVVKRASLRPTSVVARRESDSTQVGSSVSVFTLPDDASLNAGLVLDTIAIMIATPRLIMGDTIEFALRKVALGCDDIREKVLLLHGVALHRTTINNILRKLVKYGCLERVGRLPRRTDLKLNATDGRAYIYALKVGMRQVGSLAQAAFEQILPILPLSATVSRSRGTARLQGCLKWAVNHAVHGNRNAIGAWLMFRCRDIGVNYPTAKTTMESYQRNADRGRPLYTWAEAERTLRSVYRIRKPATPGEWL